MGVMALEMMSSRVHWASDYPLAVLIGYVIGKTAANRRIIKKDTDIEKVESNSSALKIDFKMGEMNTYKTLGIAIQF